MLPWTHLSQNLSRKSNFEVYEFKAESISYLKFYFSFFCGVCHSLFPPHLPNSSPQKEFSYSWLRKQRGIHQPLSAARKTNPPIWELDPVFFWGIGSDQIHEVFFLNCADQRKNSLFVFGRMTI